MAPRNPRTARLSKRARVTSSECSTRVPYSCRASSGVMFTASIPGASVSMRGPSGSRRPNRRASRSALVASASSTRFPAAAAARAMTRRDGGSAHAALAGQHDEPRVEEGRRRRGDSGRGVRFTVPRSSRPMHRQWRPSSGTPDDNGRRAQGYGDDQAHLCARSDGERGIVAEKRHAHADDGNHATADGQSAAPPERARPRPRPGAAAPQGWVSPRAASGEDSGCCNGGPGGDDTEPAAPSELPRWRPRRRNRCRAKRDAGARSLSQAHATRRQTGVRLAQLEHFETLTAPVPFGGQKSVYPPPDVAEPRRAGWPERPT